MAEMTLGYESQGTRNSIAVTFEYRPAADPPVLRYINARGSQDEVPSEEIPCAEVVGVLSKPEGAYEILVTHLTELLTKPEGCFEVVEATGLPEYFLAHYLINKVPRHLLLPPNPDGSPNIHIIASTGSGAGEAGPFCEHGLKPVLKHLGISETTYAVHTTKSADTVKDLTRDIFLPRAQQGIQQTIVLLSGDGGVHDLVNGLLTEPHSEKYAKPDISPLVFGTGNALASSAKDPQTETSSKGLTQLLRGSPKPLPTFKVNFSPGSVLIGSGGADAGPIDHIFGAVVCSWGFHAILVADSDTAEYRKHGAKRFGIVAQELLFPSDGSPSHHYRGKISLFKTNGQGEKTEVVDRREHMYLLTTLVSNLEEKFKISPASKPLDGKLRVLHFGAIGADTAMGIMMKAYQPQADHVDDERIGYEEIVGMRLDMEEEGETNARWRRVCIDGMIVRLPEKGWMEVRTIENQPVNIIFSG